MSLRAQPLFGQQRHSLSGVRRTTLRRGEHTRKLNDKPAHLKSPPADGAPRRGAVSPPPCQPVPRGQREMSLQSVATLVVWLGCLAIGWLGLALPYHRPVPPAKTLEPIQAELLNVELTDDPLPVPDETLPLPAKPALPPPLLEPVVAPPSPPMQALAEPGPAIAFPVPVEKPAVVVEASQAGRTAPAAIPVAPAPAPVVQSLTHGSGEGKQPSPTYPRRALREGQEGTVAVRFSVGEDGRVLSTEAVSPSPWPLLNAEALRVIRERWRFRPGTLRLYEVAIHFELRK
jgi:protein TonB